LGYVSSIICKLSLFETCEQKSVEKSYNLSMKNITDFLLNFFLQGYVVAYGKQVLPDFIMLVHS